MRGTSGPLSATKTDAGGEIPRVARAASDSPPSTYIDEGPVVKAGTVVT
jgi:hypothetical protein